MTKPQKLVDNENVAMDWFNTEFEIIKKRIKPHFHGVGYIEFVKFVKFLCQNNFTYSKIQNNRVYESRIRNVFDSDGNIQKEKLRKFFKNLGDTLENMHNEKYNEAAASLSSCFDEPDENRTKQFAPKAAKIEEFTERFLLPWTNEHGYSKVLFEHFAKRFVRLGKVESVKDHIKSLLNDFDKAEEERDNEYGLEAPEKLSGDDLEGLFSSEEMNRLYELRNEYLKSQENE